MAAPQTGLTSCQIGDIGYPRTVHANPRDIHIPLFLTLSTYANISIIPDDEDYTRQEVVLTFDEDTQRICRDIDVTDDDVTEEDEDFVVTLTTDDDQAETGPPDRAVVTIEDNDRESSGMELRDMSHFV